MVKTQSSPILELIRRVVVDPQVRCCADQDLLQQFLDKRDEAAFEALVRRHGPMVLDVCRGMLPNEADVEDAFQATFLILARKANSIGKAASLGSWLHGVAYRTACKARTNFARRRAREAAIPPPQAVKVADAIGWREVREVVHEELHAISERYRAPLVLCYLEGKTQDEAAALLGLARSTLKDRLECGRAILRARLMRCGLGPAAALVAAAWPAASAACLAPPLVTSTVQAAAICVAGEAAGGIIPAQVAALTERVVQSMFLTKLKIAVLLALAFVGGGAGALILPTVLAGKENGNHDTPVTIRAGGQKAEVPKAQPKPGNPNRLQGTWSVLATENVDPTVDPKDLLRQALEAAQKVRPEDRSSYATKDTLLALIADTFLKAGDTKAAAETVRAFNSEHAKHPVLVRIATAQATAGDAESAFRIAGELPASWKAAALAGIAAAQAKHGDKTSAQHTFRRALETARAESDAAARGHALSGIAACQADASDFAGALNTMTAAGLSDDGIRHGLKRIALAQARARAVPEALKTLAKAEELEGDLVLIFPYSVAGALPSIVSEQAEAGDVEGAVKLACLPKRASQRAIALAVVAKAQARRKDRGGAKATARAALTALSENAGQPEQERAEGLYLIAEVQFRTDDAKGADKTFQLAVEAAGMIPDKDVQSLVFQYLAASLARAGFTQRGIAVAERIQDVGMRAGGLSMVAAARAEAGDIEGALRMAERVGKGLMASTIASVVRAQAVGDLPGALGLALKQGSPQVRSACLTACAEAVLERPVESKAR